MKLPKPPIVTGGLPGQVRSIFGYLVQLHRALETELENLRKTAKDRGPGMDEIIGRVMTSERVLDAIYKYCEKRRKKEEAENGTTS